MIGKIKPIFSPKKDIPMSVIVFASGGGGNLKAAISASEESDGKISVDLVVTDRLEIPAIEIARKKGIKVIARDFEKECGVWRDCRKDPKRRSLYKKSAISFHNEILKEIKIMEKNRKRKFGLAVLSYHRWIHGKLLEYFRDRMINQHAGDLTVLQKKDRHWLRKYIGINPVLMAFKKGEHKTRTSTFLVGSSHDGGEILCQGPWVEYTGPVKVTRETAWEHEVMQKRLSDWPSLKFALKGIALGNFGVVTGKRYKDGCRYLCYKGKELSYGGVDISKYGKR